MGKEIIINKLKNLLNWVMSALKNKWVRLILLLVIIFVLFKTVSAQITERGMKIAYAQPINVEVIELKTEDVKKSFEFSGRIEAKYTVDLIARVQGFLQKSYFKEGDFVKKGQVLFLIEPKEYEIAVRNAQAALNATRASLVNAEKNLTRARELVKQDFVSKSYYDDALAQRDNLKGSLEVNRAQLAQAKLNLSYTKIVAPVDGKIGKILITQGNLVNLSSGTIAKLISTNPIYVTFTLKSEDYLKFKKADSTQDVSNTIVNLKLSDGSEYKQNGKIEFIDNSIDSATGTITMRATFENSEGLLVPGDYITVTLSPINPRKEILVPFESVQDSEDGFFVYVIESDSKTQKDGKPTFNDKINAFIAKKLMHIEPYTGEKKVAKVRHIKAHEQYGNFWIIDEGLKEGDIIITKGITKQGLKDGSPVKIVEPKTENKENTKETK